MTPQTLEQVFQDQINRIEKGWAEPTPIARTAIADLVKHVAGPRKPSLSQQELEGKSWIPSMIR